mgnify:CR=1 FL=1
MFLRFKKAICAMRVEHIMPITALIYISMFFPGLMTADSIGTYNSAKSGVYTDHHPPMMAFVWSFFDYFYEGPACMFIVNMALMWSALFLGSKLFSKRYLRLWFVLLTRWLSVVF